VGYDDKKQRFVFPNTWGPNWGRRGLGFLPYSYFPSRFIEGWILTLLQSPIKRDKQAGIEIRSWGIKTPLGNIQHGVEIYDHHIDEMIAWGFAIERENTLDLEELFVRPKWRKQGYGSELAKEFVNLSTCRGKKLHAWIPHPDVKSENKLALEKILYHLNLKFKQSPFRWASGVGEWRG
jgi:GNAT superfamily N-acetyltransferase